MKISVIGSGYWGKNLVRNFHALNALHNICDSNPDTLGITVRIAHYPAYCSKYNPIEYRLLPHVIRALSGVVLDSA